MTQGCSVCIGYGRVLVAIVAATASCRPHEPTQAATSVGGQVWTVDSAPLRVIGEADGVAFDGIWGVDLLANGTVLVVDTDAPAIWLFPVDGGDPIKVGRKGAGPGEYRRPQFLNLLADDGFAIYDDNHRRVTTYGPDGVFRSAMPFLAADRDSMRVAPTQLLPGGALLALRHRWPRPTADGPLHMTADIIRLDSMGVVTAEFGHFGYADWMSLTSDGSLMIFPQWFGWNLVAGYSHRYAAIGENHTYAITIFDLEGKPVGSIGEERPARPVSEAQRDSIVAMMKPRDESPAMTSPESFSRNLPEFRKILIDPAGFVWVTPYQVGSGAPDTVAIFTHEGKRVATLATPAGLRLGAIGDSTIVGITSDSNDVQSVTVLRLRRYQAEERQ